MRAVRGRLGPRIPRATVAPGRRLAVADDQTYAFENASPGQRDRLRTLEALLDAGTIRHLEHQGVGSGWHCLEVGAGGGSIASWLSSRVGPEGSVLATDLDISHLRALSHPNLEVRVHDVLQDDLPAGGFDLIHLRLVLAWLADVPAGLQRLIAALKPGARLLAEELDFAAAVPDPHMDAEDGALFELMRGAHHQVLAEVSGFDPLYGRRVVGDLERAGLAGVDCQGRAAMWRGDGPGGRIWWHTISQLREPMVTAGVATHEEVDRALALFDDPRFSSVSPVVMAAWGTRHG